jgi:heat shock protein HslJ
MKNLFLVIISLSVAIISWGFIEKDLEDCTFDTIEPDSTIYQKWTVTILNGKDDVKEKAGKNIPYLEFQSNNKLSGYTGCNNVYGKVFITKSKITFSEVTTTKMICRNDKFNSYEQEIEDLIFYKKAFKYKIEAGILTIYKKGKEVMVLEKAN